MKSLNVFLSFVILITLLGCQNNKKWEYKVVKIPAQDYSRTSYEAKWVTSVMPKDSLLNSYGADGWELTTSYLEIQTSFPNFGNEEYVTGLQPNVRPQDVVLIFKRITK
jgi:uncharacterized lipoprotein NlpE involved in copper resistance